MIDREYIWILFAKKTAGEATEQELSELQELLEKHRGISIRWETILEARARPGQQDQEEAERAFARHLERWPGGSRHKK